MSEYRSIAPQEIGLPRGVGVSAYLSELYMRQFDNEIQYYPEIVFYARYVDDIVVVISPEPSSNADDVINGLKEKISSLGLSINANKTDLKNLLSS